MNKVLTCLLLCFGLTSITSVFSDVRSTTGNIHFDINSDNSNDMTIDPSGLGIGTTPSANLHIAGNASLENGNVGIGTTGTNSTLEVQGSIGYSIESVSTDTVLSGNSIVLVDSSSDNVIIELPDAFDSIGRQYTIKKISSSNKVLVSAASGNIDRHDLIPLETSQSGFPYLSVMSSANNQYDIVSISGNGDTISGDNLIGWWKLDEISGTTTNDSSSYGNDGTLEASMSFSTNSVDAPMGNALSFDGSNDYVAIGSPSVLNLTSNKVSVSLWAKTAASPGTNRYLWSKSDNNGWVGYAFYTGGSQRIQFFIGIGNAAASVASTTFSWDNEWHHFVGTYDGSNVRLYVDGSEDAASPTASTNTIVDSSSRNAEIGRYNGGLLWFPGSIDDVRIYSRPLSASEIQTLYQTGK